MLKSIMTQFQNLKSIFLHGYGGVRTPIRQYASCVLVDVDDTLPSIFSSDMAIGNYVAQRANIGINAAESEGLTPELEAVKSTHRSYTIPQEV